jgi:hypothetical protein
LDLESGWKIIEEGDNKVLSGSGHFGRAQIKIELIFIIISLENC